jgi:3-carboxy-cis,cis-muconate cycloisomerase
VSPGLFGGLFARGDVAAEVSDRAFLQAMLDAEVALAHGLVSAGLTAPECAAEIEAAAADAGSYDIDELGRGAGEEGTPVPALLRELRGRISGAAGDALHRGATSQDIVDTAAMLTTRRALRPLLRDLGGCVAGCAILAEQHRESAMAGRTLLQQAAPTTFGLKAAGWLLGLDGARSDLAALRRTGLWLQFGGAVGTLAALGDAGLEVAAAMAERLELTMPTTPWHTNRVPAARLAGSLAVACGAMGKVARDVALLAQTEVGELREGGERGGSSTLPQKRNPVRAMAVIACADRAPGLGASVLAAMSPELERGAGGWQGEWASLAELLRLTGSAASALSDLLGGLEIDTERMRANIDPLSMSESLVVALARAMGPAAARTVVAEAAARANRHGTSFRDALLESPEIASALGAEGLDAALDPSRYLGATETLIDRALGARSTTDAEEAP